MTSAADDNTRMGPNFPRNILNPPAQDITMTHNNPDGAAAPAGFYPTSLTHSDHSRAFDLFLTRDTLDSFNLVESATTGRSEPPVAAPNSPSSSSSASSFPRPSHLEGSHYLARLEQQTRQRAASQWEVSGVQSANGHNNGANSASTPEAHYGIARDVVERPPVHHGDDEDNAVGPLPTRWGVAKEDKASGLEVMADGLEVKYTGPRNNQERENDACAIRADHPMPLQCGLYYFEITVLSRKHNDTTICIGFSSKSVALNRAPGWEPESWGYHGDDGNSFASQNVGKRYGPPFSSGDTIGCGVNFRTGTAFFTKNGQYLGWLCFLIPVGPSLEYHVLTRQILHRTCLQGSQGEAVPLCWTQESRRTRPSQLWTNAVHVRYRHSYEGMYTFSLQYFHTFVSILSPPFCTSL